MRKEKDINITIVLNIKFFDISVNQTTANVSVVRLGQTESDAENGDITLTVDPPPFLQSTTSSISANAGTDSVGLVDPFMEMDPEQLKTIETALKSEAAKQMLGENVTAMLGILFFFLIKIKHFSCLCNIKIFCLH